MTAALNILFDIACSGVSREIFKQADAPIAIDKITSTFARLREEFSTEFPVLQETAKTSLLILGEKVASFARRYAYCEDFPCMQAAGSDDLKILGKYALMPTTLRLMLIGGIASSLTTWWSNQDPQAPVSKAGPLARRTVSLAVAGSLVYGVTRFTPYLGESLTVIDLIEDVAHIAAFSLLVNATYSAVSLTGSICKCVAR